MSTLEAKRRSETKGMKPEIAEPKTVWIPPPALTSSLWKLRQKKKDQRVASDSTVSLSGAKESHFAIHLKDLLKQIHQLKVEIAGEERVNDVVEKRATLLSSIEAVEVLETTIKKAVNDLKRLSQNEEAYQMSISGLKAKLEENYLENERLTRQRDVLKEKLEKVERNATEAMEHILAMQSFIEAFNGLKLNQTQEFHQTVVQDMLDKLTKLDQANQSLQNVIGTSDNAARLDGGHSDKNEGTTTKFVISGNDAVELTQRVKAMESHIKEDQAEMVELRTAVFNANKQLVKEKKALSKSLISHKEKANRYVSVMGALKLQLSHKNSEANEMIAEISSLKLWIARLVSERDRLEIEKATLSERLGEMSSKIEHQAKTTSSPLQELTSKLAQHMTKIDSLELENENLKFQLSSKQNEILKCQEQLRVQDENLKMLEKRSLEQNEIRFKNVIVGAQENKSVQAMPDTNDEDTSGNLGSTPNGKFQDRDRWMQVTELWKQLQSDKLNILQTLKDLEQKLERSQDANLEFRRELSQKEDLIHEINVKLQEKIEENLSLKQHLDSALNDARKYAEQAKESSLSSTQIMQSKITELERHLQECRKENAQLRQVNSETDKRHSLQVRELEERLRLAERSKKTMNDYIVFLKSSYATVFGDDSLATKNVAL